MPLGVSSAVNPLSQYVIIPEHSQLRVQRHVITNFIRRFEVNYPLFSGTSLWLIGCLESRTQVLDKY